MARTSYSTLFLAVLAAMLVVTCLPWAEAKKQDDKKYKNYEQPKCPSKDTTSGEPCGNAVFVKKGCKVQVEILDRDAAYTDEIYTCKKTRGGLVPNQYIGNAADLGKKVEVAVLHPGELIFCINVTFPLRPELGVNDLFYSGCASRNSDGGVHAAVFQLKDYAKRRSLLDKKSDDDDNNKDYCSRSLIMAFEDRRANQPDRPEAPSNPKDFNDAVIKITGCIKCFTAKCDCDDFVDCDNKKWNGRETDVSADYDNCGACDSSCSGAQTCDDGYCVGVSPA